MVLDVSRDDRTTMQDGRSVDRSSGTVVRREAVQVAHDGDDLAIAIRVERGGKVDQACDGCVLEGAAQREVLNRIAGEHHLGKGDDVWLG